jgi:hypothetical protein
MWQDPEDRARIVATATDKVIAIVTIHAPDDECHVRFFDGTGLCIRDDGQSCCEYRYMTCDDDLSKFRLARLLDITEKEGPTTGDDELHEEVFIHIETDKGSIVLCSHNEHNGYYGGFSIAVTELNALAPEALPTVEGVKGKRALQL